MIGFQHVEVLGARLGTSVTKTWLNWICNENVLWIELGGGSHMQKPSNPCKCGQWTLNGDDDEELTHASKI